MKSFGIIVAMLLVTMSMPLTVKSSPKTHFKEPISLCAKSDFSMCANVTYPDGCVGMDNVTLPVTVNGTAVTAIRVIESVIVQDPDSTERGRCVVLFETNNCQGQALVLNATYRPAARLERYGFANRAESYRQCSDRLLDWLINRD